MGVMQQGGTRLCLFVHAPWWQCVGRAGSGLNLWGPPILPHMQLDLPSASTKNRTPTPRPTGSVCQGTPSVLGPTAQSGYLRSPTRRVWGQLGLEGVPGVPSARLSPAPPSWLLQRPEVPPSCHDHQAGPSDREHSPAPEAPSAGGPRVSAAAAGDPHS